MRRGGEKADIGRMSAVDVGMRNPAKYGEIVAKFLQILQVRRQGVVSPAVFWEKGFGQYTEIVANGEHPAGRARAAGAVAAAALADLGSMASNNGSEMDTPAARKNLRRDTRRRWDMPNPTLPVALFRPDFTFALSAELDRSIVDFPGTTYLF